MRPDAFVTGLYRGPEPWFLRWQLAITYFGAGLNKLIDVDWHSGVFENWPVNRLHQPWYIALDALLPPMVLACFMCWTTIGTELGIVPAILISEIVLLGDRRKHSFPGRTFAFHRQNLYFVFLQHVGRLTGICELAEGANSGFASKARRYFQLWDMDGRFLWTPSPPESSRNGSIFLRETNPTAASTPSA